MTAPPPPSSPLALDQVERELARLWEEEARRSRAARVELLTLVALVSEPRLLARAQKVVEQVVCAHPSRTIAAVYHPGEAPELTATVTLHRVGGAACGDSIGLAAVGGARDWLPGNVERLALPELPVCLWWVGDLPDFDTLFDRLVLASDLVVVNSAEMDLRDLEKLASIVLRSRDRCALADLTWIRLRWLQELIARFFDDEAARGCLPTLERIVIELAPREGDTDVTSTTAGLLLGWIANVLQLTPDGAKWKAGAGWAEVTLGSVVARFERRPRGDVRPGAIVRVAFECRGGFFEIACEQDPDVFRWSRDVPGAATPPQRVRAQGLGEAELLVRTLERPHRDRLFESSLSIGSRIVRPVAPRLSTRPRSG